MRERAVSACWIVAASLAGASIAASLIGAQPATQPPTFTGRVNVVEVEVPVEVRNRNGEPVRGLTADAFRLFDEGKERAISHFEAVDLSIVEPDSEPVTAPAPPVAPPRPRHILLLFDLTFSNPIAIGRARLAARQVVLESLPPSDLVAVALFSVEFGPRMLVTFTPDRAQVARALDSLSFDRVAEFRTLDPLRFLVPFQSRGATETQSSGQERIGELKSEISQIGGETAQILAESAEKESQRYQISRITTWAQGLGELGRYLASISGRKQVLLFSEGFDSRLMLGRSDLNDPEVAAEARNSEFGQTWRVDSDLRFGNTPLMNEAARMIEQLRRGDCVVNAVDIGGLRAGSEGRRNSRSPGQDALFYFANESGGQLFTDANDLSERMRKTLERSESSYLLTFQAEDVPTDGSWRKLRVELKEARGLHVVSRSGWYAPRPFPELHPFERDLLAADAIATGAPENEIRLSLLAAAFRAGTALAYVPVILEIDGPTLLAGMSEPQRVQLYAYATTRKGEFRSFFHRELRIDPARSAAALSRGGVKYYGHFELPPDEYLLRVLVREEGSGRVGAALSPLSVPDFAKARTTLLAPFFFDRPGRWTMVRERGETGGGGSIIYPFVALGDPFVPQAAPSFRTGEKPRFWMMAYNLAGEDLELEASWLTESGEEPIALTSHPGVTGATDSRQWLGEIDLARVASGEHRFRVAVVDRASGRQVASTEGVLRVEG